MGDGHDDMIDRWDDGFDYLAAGADLGPPFDLELPVTYARERTARYRPESRGRREGGRESEKYVRRVHDYDPRHRHPCRRVRSASHDGRRDNSPPSELARSRGRRDEGDARLPTSRRRPRRAADRDASLMARRPGSRSGRGPARPWYAPSASPRPARRNGTHSPLRSVRDTDQAERRHHVQPTERYHRSHSPTPAHEEREQSLPAKYRAVSPSTRPRRSRARSTTRWPSHPPPRPPGPSRVPSPSPARPRNHHRFRSHSLHLRHLDPRKLDPRKIDPRKFDQKIKPRWQRVGLAALQAGGLAAIQARAQPGAWAGDKGIRVATAALGAGATDAMHKDGSRRDKIDVEAVTGALGGLVLDQLGRRVGRH